MSTSKIEDGIRIDSQLSFPIANVIRTYPFATKTNNQIKYPRTMTILLLLKSTNSSASPSFEFDCRLSVSTLTRINLGEDVI